MTRYTHDSDRARLPVLVVGMHYHHRDLGVMRIERRLSNPGGSCRYCFSVDGVVQGEQNDFALLNQVVNAPPIAPQLALL